MSRDRAQLLEKQASHTQTAFAFRYDEGQFRGTAILIQEVSSDSAEPFQAGHAAWFKNTQRRVPILPYPYQRLGALPRHLPDGEPVTQVKGLRGMAVKELLERPLVGGSQGSQ